MCVCEVLGNHEGTSPSSGEHSLGSTRFGNSDVYIVVGVVCTMILFGQSGNFGTLLNWFGIRCEDGVTKGVLHYIYYRVCRMELSVQCSQSTSCIEVSGSNHVVLVAWICVHPIVDDITVRIVTVGVQAIVCSFRNCEVVHEVRNALGIHLESIKDTIGGLVGQCAIVLHELAVCYAVEIVVAFVADDGEVGRLGSCEAAVCRRSQVAILSEELTAVAGNGVSLAVRQVCQCANEAGLQGAGNLNCAVRIANGSRCSIVEELCLCR